MVLGDTRTVPGEQGQSGHGRVAGIAQEGSYIYREYTVHTVRYSRPTTESPIKIVLSTRIVENSASEQDQGIGLHSDARNYAQCWVCHKAYAQRPSNIQFTMSYGVCSGH